MRFGPRKSVALALVCIALSALALASASPQVQWDEPPDLVLRPAAARTIAARSLPHTFRYELPSEQVKDRWIRAVDFRPGDSRVVQRAFFFVEKTGQWIGAWAPGQKMIPFPDTVAAILPVGSKIFMDVRYEPTESDTRDSSSLAIYFTDKKPLRPLSGIGVSSRVMVPASTPTFTLRKEFTIINDSYALAVRPEMLAAGRAVEITTLDPSGVSQVLLSIRNFNKDIQPPYVFDEPLFIAKGTRIVTVSSYQNYDADPTEDMFKLTMSLYPVGEVRPAMIPTAGRVAAPAPARRTTAVKKAPAKKAPVKKAPIKKTTPKKP